jgi:hypothetical protein
MKLVAYRVSAGSRVELEPAPAQREWMQVTRDAFANRCLPLLIANQAGWHVLNPVGVRVRWNGGDRIPDLVIERIGEDVENAAGASIATSHFGSGIVTFTIPYLFRTPPGWNLLVRGPANLPKDGASALEGLVETDWNPATFTMNWILTRPGAEVIFEPGEPIAMIVPMRRGDLELLEPEVKDMYDDREVASTYRAWRKSRADFLEDLPIPGTDANREGWQRDYVLGKTPDGTVVKEHQRKLALKPFRRG